MSFLFKQQPGDITVKFQTIHTTSAVLGLPLPIVFGQRRLGGKLLWYGDLIVTNAPVAGGSALNSKAQQQYVYYASVVIGLAQGVCTALKNVWSGQDIFGVFSNTVTFAVPIGGGSSPRVIPPNTNANADEGVSLNDPYSITVSDFGSPGSTTLTGTQSIPLIPGVDYTFNLSSAIYTFPSSSRAAGKTVTISTVYYTQSYISNELIVVPPGGLYTPQHQNVYDGDEGVTYYPSGVALKAVSSPPTVKGTYYPGPPPQKAGVPSNTGKYQFYVGTAPNDVGQNIVVNYKWVNPTGSGSTPTYLNMTFFNGALGQLPWSYLSTITSNVIKVNGANVTVGNFNLGVDLGYNEICYVGSSNLYLGYQPTMPNYNYEVAGLFLFGGGIVDANPALCIESLVSDSTFGIGLATEFIDPSLMGVASNFWVANGFFISALIEQQKTAASVIGPWCEASQVGNWWSEGLWKFAPYADTSVVGNGAIFTPPTNPVVNLTDSDFISDGPQDDPVKIKEIAWPDRYNKVGVRWSVRSNSYNDDVLYGQDDASILTYGLRQESPVTYDFICTENTAQLAANLRVQRYTSIKNQYEFKLKGIYPYLEPMDVIEISDSRLGLTNLPVRIISIEDDPKAPLSVVCEDFPWSIATAVLYPKQTQLTGIAQDTNQDPGNTDLLVFEAPGSITGQQGNTMYVFVNGQDSSWGGCQIYMSFDQNLWTPLVKTITGGRFGVLASPLPSGADPDLTDTLTVNMENSRATLSTVSQAAADSFATLSAIIEIGTGVITSEQNIQGNGYDFSNPPPFSWFNAQNFGSATLYGDVTVSGSGASAQSSKYAGTGSDVDQGVGFPAWSNPTNIQGPPDSSYTSSVLVMTGSTQFAQTQLLLASGYSFAVPSTNIITGLLLNVTGYVSCASTPNIIEAQLIAAVFYQGAQIGSTRSVLIPSVGTSTTPISFLFGSSSDEWSTTLTPAIVNDPSFTIYMFVVTEHTLGLLTDTITIAYDAANATVYSVAPTPAGTSARSAYGYAFNYGFNLESGSPLSLPPVLGFQVDFDAMIDAFPTDGGTASIGVQITCPVTFTDPLPGVISNSRIVQIVNTSTGSPATDNWQRYTVSGPVSQLIDWGINLSGTQVQESQFGVLLTAILTNTFDTVNFRVRNLKITVYTEAGTAIELISYENAALTGLNQYGLTYLRRGVHGTQIQDWPIGSNFARLDSANYVYQYPNSMIGKVVYLKATSFNQFGNQQQGLEDVEALIVPLQGFAGAFDLLSGSLSTGAGGAVPSWTGTLTYTSTTTTITWIWNFTLLRNDGTTQLFQGSQLITGLTANTVYYFYPYVDDTNGVTNAVVTMVTGVSGVGTPPWAQVIASYSAAQLASTSTHLALSDAILAAATTVSGSGGGINGGRSPFFT